MCNNFSDYYMIKLRKNPFGMNYLPFYCSSFGESSLHRTNILKGENALIYTANLKNHLKIKNK